MFASPELTNHGATGEDLFLFSIHTHRREIYSSAVMGIRLMSLACVLHWFRITKEEFEEFRALDRW